jgi:hypothetical protein
VQEKAADAQVAREGEESMNAARTPNAKAVDFSQTRERNMEHCIQAFVMRRSSVSLRTIQKWFSATPPEFVAEQVDAAVRSQKIAIRRNGLSRRAGYVYEADSRCN